MKLTELMDLLSIPAAAPAPFGQTGSFRQPGPIDPEILGITADSRAVRLGFLFAALPGARLDGRRFARDAVARGAVAILTDSAAALDLDTESRARVAVVIDDNPRRLLALMAARFHEAQPRTVVAVTGTNGKTSVAHFTREIWSLLGRKAASLGTLGIVTAGGRHGGALTTPDPVALHDALERLARDGVDHLAVEASSHGLDQHRLDGLSIAAAAFTNLTRDHLDYHATLDAYRAAKTRLFADLLPADGTAVLNADSTEHDGLAALCRMRGQRILSYGEAADADLRLVSRRPDGAAQALELDILGYRRHLRLPLAGAFQASNALAALGLVIATGAPAPAATDALAHLTGVPGRLQRVALLGPPGEEAAVYVDFAHTPDALETVLTALRPHASGRLIVVFGCGGDRDPGKRPLMGAAATRLADKIIVTDDNPRSESPAAIRQAIRAAAPGADEIGDRREAIAAGIASLAAGDILIVAGKGHESGQTIGTEVHPFDDAVVARALARERGGRT